MPIYRITCLSQMGNTGSNDASIETPIANEVSIYEELLGLIPDTPENRFGLYISDYALARQVFDVFCPGQRQMKRSC